MQTIQKQSVWPVVVVIGVVLVGVVLIGLFGRSGTSSEVRSTAPVVREVKAVTSEHVLGAADAPITIVEYADFQCPSCKLFSPMLARLVTESEGKVSVAYRYFTLPQHKNAIPAAQAAEAAAQQGKFWEMHDMLFEKQTEWENVADGMKVFTEYAGVLGLDVPKFMADVASDAVMARVAGDTADAMKSGLNHTPTLLVNGKEISNPASYEALKALIDQTIVPQ